MTFYQKPATLSRPPVSTFPLSELVGTAELRMADLICAALAPVFTEAYKAQAPVTCGVAMDVPL